LFRSISGSQRGSPARRWTPATIASYVIACSNGGRPVQTSGDFIIAAEHDETALARAYAVVIATQEPEGLRCDKGCFRPKSRPS
jgi:hypothetical protein